MKSTRCCRTVPVRSGWSRADSKVANEAGTDTTVIANAAVIVRLELP